ncbi:DUF4190 domain-containing protein [Aeromicrobium sp. CF4.19]|uniref:DUF4190 domain-containing protein n=1 Tax=Aeromicrobium sp. CF4.19 TaxID=3373082 RepID=UPI003EE648C0
MASLVLGIVGLTGLMIVVTFVVSPLAWYFGAVARREAQRDEQRWAPSGAATAGLVMGAIGTVLLIGGTVVLVGLAVLSALVAGTDTGYGG